MKKKKKIQNKVQNICGKIMKIHVIYVHVYKCVYIYIGVQNITYNIHKHTYMHIRKEIGKGTLFSSYAFA